MTWLFAAFVCSHDCGGLVDDAGGRINNFGGGRGGRVDPGAEAGQRGTWLCPHLLRPVPHTNVRLTAAILVCAAIFVHGAAMLDYVTVSAAANG